MQNEREKGALAVTRSSATAEYVVITMAFDGLVDLIRRDRVL